MEKLDVVLQNEVKAVWQAPVVSILEIKRTLFASGAGTDGGIHSSP